MLSADQSAPLAPQALEDVTAEWIGWYNYIWRGWANNG
jgi:hypothetical protein